MQDAQRLGLRRLGEVDLLEPARESPVFFEMILEFLIGARADAPHPAAVQQRFEQVRRVHRAAAHRAGADDSVDFVDEQDDLFLLLERLDDGLQPGLEIPAVSRSGEKGAHIEGEDAEPSQGRRNLFLLDHPGQAFDDRRLAHPGLADEHDVVLPPARQDSDGSLEFGVPSHQRVDLAGGGLLVQTLGELAERILHRLLAELLPSRGHLAAGQGLFAVLRSALVRRLVTLIVLRHAMRNIFENIQP
ncbi:MAG: hypothetical protein BWY66_00948 [bacterium ADurb.Bin374]|nr:MAG: hypothetical protein BWY66_00948 [bacterium ADurb.Bin374]